jgi:signal transduction histidine kinase
VRGEEARSNLGGSGLGLSIAERAAAMNGFTLKLSSTDEEFRAELRFR